MPGAYRFPFEYASKIAYNTVKSFLEKPESIKKVIFVLFSDIDLTTFIKISNEMAGK